MSLVAHQPIPLRSLTTEAFSRDLAVLDLPEHTVSTIERLPDMPNRSIQDGHTLPAETLRTVNDSLARIAGVIRIGPVVAIERMQVRSGPAFFLNSFMGFRLRDRDRAPNALLVPLGTNLLDLELLLLPIPEIVQQIDSAHREQAERLGLGESPVPEPIITAVDSQYRAHISIQPGQALVLPDELLCYRWRCESRLIRVKGYFKADPALIGSCQDVASRRIV